jgi:Ca2+-binding RTX toxin-like protein
MSYTGRDLLKGGAGADELHGGAGIDRLFGQRGFDKLFGEGKKDILSGGPGNDKLFGGRGQDVFVFRDGDGTDRVMDFRDDVDTIRLDDNLWRGALTKAQVIDEFAYVHNGNVVFDFGDESLVIRNFTDLAELRDDLQIV